MFWNHVQCKGLGTPKHIVLVHNLSALTRSPLRWPGSADKMVPPPTSIAPGVFSAGSRTVFQVEVFIPPGEAKCMSVSCLHLSEEYGRRSFYILAIMQGPSSSWMPESTIDAPDICSGVWNVLTFQHRILHHEWYIMVYNGTWFVLVCIDFCCHVTISIHFQGHLVQGRRRPRRRLLRLLRLRQHLFLHLKSWALKNENNRFLHASIRCRWFGMV